MNKQFPKPPFKVQPQAIPGRSALAFAREGADVLVAYLDEYDDANEAKRLVEQAGRKCVLLAGGISNSDHCREIVKRAVGNSGELTCWSITPLIRGASTQSKRYPMKNGKRPFPRIFPRCSTSSNPLSRTCRKARPSSIRPRSTRTLPVLISWPTPPPRVQSRISRAG
jgi:hypothetical protein